MGAEVETKQLLLYGQALARRQLRPVANQAGSGVVRRHLPRTALEQSDLAPRARLLPPLPDGDGALERGDHRRARPETIERAALRQRLSHAPIDDRPIDGVAE